MHPARARAYPVSPDPGQENPLDQTTLMKSWERLPRETDSDWLYFRAYLDQAYPEGLGGPYVPRNVSELARSLGLNRHTLAERSGAFHWPQRAGAWDREVESRKREAELTEVQKTRTAHLRMVRKLRNLVEAELDKLQARSSQSPEIPVFTSKDLHGMFDLAVKLERMLVGENTANAIAGGDPEVNLENLELEDLETLYAITQRAKAKTA